MKNPSCFRRLGFLFRFIVPINRHSDIRLRRAIFPFGERYHCVAISKQSFGCGIFEIAISKMHFKSVAKPHHNIRIADISHCFCNISLRSNIADRMVDIAIPICRTGVRQIGICQAETVLVQRFYLVIFSCLTLWSMICREASSLWISSGVMPICTMSTMA